VQFAASPIPEGALLRVAGPDAASVSAVLHHHLMFLESVLDELPWTRKG
jgi:hypothetical protein